MLKCGLQIEEIALLNTTLTRYDGAKVVYPNPKMNADMVVNLNRSGNRNESIKVPTLQHLLDLNFGSVPVGNNTRSSVRQGI